MVEYPAGWTCERTALWVPPELLVGKVHERFDSGLRLKDEGTRKVLGDLLTRFGRWIARERAAAEADRELATKAG